MFLEGFVEVMESEIRNAEIFQILTCYSIPFLFVENHFAFTIIILFLIYRILNRVSKKPWLIKA